MSKFKRDLEKYKRTVYDLITEQLGQFQEKYEPFNKENGVRFMNKVIELAMKVSLYPKLLQLYRDFDRNDVDIRKIVEEMFDDYANKLQVNYASTPKEHPPMWGNAADACSHSKTIKINDKIDKLVDNLNMKIGIEYTNIINKYEYTQERCEQFIEANELFEFYFIPHLIYRAARADGIGKDGMTKYIKENIFWKGRAAEIVAIVKNMEFRSAE